MCGSSVAACQYEILIEYRRMSEKVELSAYVRVFEWVNSPGFEVCDIPGLANEQLDLKIGVSAGREWGSRLSIYDKMYYVVYLRMEVSQY